MEVLRKISMFIFLVLSAKAGAQNTLVVGSYVGDGAASKAITGIGFQPNVVIVKGNTAQHAYIKTSNMTGDSSKNMETATDLEVDRIKTLDAGGFTVGGNAAVNTNGVTYYYQAFDATANLKTGTYTGSVSSVQKITGVGWKADYVIIMPGTTASGKGACSEYFMTSSLASITRRFSNLANRTDISWSPSNTDGFEVSRNVSATVTSDGSSSSTSSGTPPGVCSSNASGKKYYYAAWNSGADMVIGSYSGNNTDNRNLSGVSIDPILFLIVKGDPTGTGVTQSGILKNAAMSGESVSYFTNSADLSTNAIQSMSASANNFQVGTDATVNANATATTYYYAAFGGPNSATPIELLSFKAKLKGKVVELSWATASEINNDYFTIERSADGMHFAPVTIVKGAGNSMSTIEYSTIDEQPLRNISYYRLKQTDFDGKFTYSRVSVINNSPENEGVVIFPNPMNNSSGNFLIKGVEDYDLITLTILDHSGKKVFEMQRKDLFGNSVLYVELTNVLAVGMYFVLIESPGRRSIQKLLVE